ncbi:MAG: hypothetical protein E7311_01635 [Clostridiales bacterium]|nr:hypothetical protein [Clostridiales bacterium]
MRLKRKKMRKRIIILVLIILFIILGIFAGIKIHNIYQTNKENLMFEEKIKNIFVLEDLELNYNSIINKYGIGTDNRNSEDKLFCTTYVSNLSNFNVIRIFYYNELMEVVKIEIYNYENSKYEVLNYIIGYLGEYSEYNNEIKELATEYKWKYKNYEVMLIDNIDSNSIIIKKINQ